MTRRPLVATLLLALSSCAQTEEPQETGGRSRAWFVTRELAFSPTDDAYVLQGSPNSNFGSATTLRVDGSPPERTLMKFDVTGIGDDRVTRARLRLFNTNSSNRGGDFSRLANTSWSESGVTWNNAPSAVGPPFAFLGRVSSSNFYEVDVTSQVTSDGIIGFGITSTSSDGADYRSKEGPSGFGPMLIVEVESVDVPPDPTPTATPSPTPVVSTSSFGFAAAGDHGANSRTDMSLQALDASPIDFYLALGDLDYDETPSDEAWCDYVKSRMPLHGPSFPFELVTGNHEEQGGPDGYILNFVECLPDRLGSTLSPTNQYGAEYYFDYPAGAPLARVIMIAADLEVEDVSYDYFAGNARYEWLSGVIDSARQAGIPWVIVGMHKVCITAGNKGCSIGSALMNLLVAKRVDLVLQAHDHNYQRSRQLAHDPATCPAVPVGSFDGDCVVPTATDNTYSKGAGALFLISGSFGRPHDDVSTSDSEAPYFVTMDDTTWGFARYRVSSDRIDAQFVNSIGAFTDSFSIIAGPLPPPVTLRTVSFTPIADAYVRADSPNSNFGTRSTIEVDNGPIKHGLLKFDTSEIDPASIVEARLRVRVTNSSNRGGDLTQTTSTWTETGVTFNNAPPAGTPLGSLGAVSSGNFYEVELRGVSFAMPVVSFKVTSTSSDGTAYESREDSASLRPQLILTVAE